jgi:HSP20 family molecular chaperone IbpA
MTVANTETETEIAKPAAQQARGPVRELRPDVDIYESADELLVVADVPGATSESVNIRFEESLLTLQADRSSPDGRRARYQRAFQVPDSVDPDKISARLDSGVLHVHLRKFEKAKPRTIAVNTH